MSDLPLSGFLIGVTAARRAEEQIALLERRGAEVVHAPALSVDPNRIDEVALHAATRDVLSTPVDIFLATTGIGMKSWLTAAERWVLLEELVAHLAQAEVLARGPKSVGALRRFGLRELWAPASEEFDDVLEHLRGRDLTGLRIVVQEHGQSLSMAAHALRRLGAHVTTVTVYRVDPADDLEPMFGLVEAVVEGRIDAVTFTAAPAVAAMMEAAATAGHRNDVVRAFQADVIASCVGPVTAAAFEMWGVPSIYPERSRLAAMVKQLETELPSRAGGTSLEDVKVLVAVAHGTRDPAGTRVAAEITSAAGRRLGVIATASYVEICEPLFADVMSRLREPAVVVPLLLSTGYHVRHDLPAAVAGAAAQVELGRPLGPDLLLAEAQVDRLVAAGAVRGQPLVMVAAGSTDPAATSDLDEAARLLADLWTAPVRLATLSGIGTRPADVVRPGDAVSPYLLAPGFFALRARAEALEAGAAVVADVIGAHPRVVDLVCQRATQLAARGGVPRAAP